MKPSSTLATDVAHFAEARASKFEKVISALPNWAGLRV